MKIIRGSFWVVRPSLAFRPPSGAASFRLMPEFVKSPCRYQPLEPLKLGRTTLASSIGWLQ